MANKRKRKDLTEKALRASVDIAADPPRSEVVVGAEQWRILKEELVNLDLLDESKLFNFDCLLVGLDFISTSMPSGRRMTTGTCYGWEASPRDQTHTVAVPASEEFLQVCLDPDLEEHDILQVLLIMGAAQDLAKRVSELKQPMKDYFKPIFGKPSDKVAKGYAKELAYSSNCTFTAACPILVDDWVWYVHENGSSTKWILENLISEEWKAASLVCMEKALQMDLKLAQTGKPHTMKDEQAYKKLQDAVDQAKLASLKGKDVRHLLKGLIPQLQPEVDGVFDVYHPQFQQWMKTMEEATAAVEISTQGWPDHLPAGEAQIQTSHPQEQSSAPAGAQGVAPGSSDLGLKREPLELKPEPIAV